VSTATEEIEATGKTGEYKYLAIIKDRCPYLPIFPGFEKYFARMNTLAYFALESMAEKRV
jgi:hypothetical protein